MNCRGKWPRHRLSGRAESRDCGPTLADLPFRRHRSSYDYKPTKNKRLFFFPRINHMLWRVTKAALVSIFVFFPGIKTNKAVQRW